MRDLAAEFGELNDEQKAGVRHPANTVVRAGPGSGKTATLVIKIAHLLSDEIRPPRGLACITYNRDTVREFRGRLSEFGIHAGPRLYLGTVHSFCLNCVLRPFAALVGDAGLATRRVVTDRATGVALQRALDAEGVPQRVSWFWPTLTRIRRYLACGEDVTDLDPAEVRVAHRYEKALRDAGQIDFESMVLEALRLVDRHSAVRDLLASRFPWLVVDEYQDLGGPLHHIVMSLSQRGGVKVFAVGDPDQTIYPFTGAHPKYLEELAKTPGFRAIGLKFNYRSGSRLIAASQAALAPEVPRDYEADPKRKDPGEVYIRKVPGGLDGQIADIVGTIIPVLTKAQMPLHEIAILYPRKGNLLTRLQQELARAGIPFNAERDERFPRSPVVKWLQQCANWAIGSASEENILFEDLVRAYEGILEDAGMADQDVASLATRRRLFVALEAHQDGELSLREWLTQMDKALDLRATIEATGTRPDDLEDYDTLTHATAPGGSLEGLRLTEFASDGRVRGRLVVTTLHSSKGRQFDAVVLPALQETLMPRRFWNRARRQYDEASPVTLAEDRRLFYVGFTRARRFVFLLYSDVFKNDQGFEVPRGPSRFVVEIQQRLSSQ